MNTETLDKYAEKFGKIAEMLGYALTVEQEDELSRWVPVKLMPPSPDQPRIHLDAPTYGKDKGRIVASLLLPVDMWGHAVRGNGDIPQTSFDPERDPHTVAKQLHKLTQHPYHQSALEEVAKRHARHEKRVSAAVDLSMALKGQGLAFTEGRWNGDKPNHDGHVDMVFYTDMGQIEITYGGGYRINPTTLDVSAWRLAKGIKTIFS